MHFVVRYPAAQVHPFPGDAYGRTTLVNGGTCDSVGVGGCWLAGCFGPFTKRFGSGAVNLLELRVVLANGTAVTTNAHMNADLFWSLRGGGGGNTAVVVDFTARTHPSPRWFSSAGYVPMPRRNYETPPDTFLYPQIMSSCKRAYPTYTTARIVNRCFHSSEIMSTL